jgi:hypothetical protein
LFENCASGFFQDEAGGVKQRGFRDIIVEDYSPDRVSKLQHRA